MTLHIFSDRKGCIIEKSRRVVWLRGTKATEKGHGTGTCSLPLFLSDPQSRLISKLEKQIAALEYIYIYEYIYIL